MIGLLEKEGYRLTNLEEANYLIVNTCGVKQPTEEKVIHTLKQLSSLGKNLIIAGCLPKINIERIKSAIPNFSAMLDPQSVNNIVEILKKIENGSKNLIIFSNEPPIKPTLPKHLLNPFIGIIQISEGCDLACSYCCTRFARGRLFCYSSREIIEEAKCLIQNGCKELYITSQDTGAYKYDNLTLADLLKGICKIEGKFFIRVGMMNPLHAKQILDDLITAYKDEKIFKFLHLPVQSFSSRILKLMKRGYEPETVLEIINKFYKAIPDLTLSTDVIVGFPTEDDSDFEETVKFIEQVKPDTVNLSKFGARPRTEASRLKQLPVSIVNKRSKELFELIRRISLEKNEKWLNWCGECLIDERGIKNGTWIGRNFAYKPIVVRSTKNLFGRFIEVEITGAKSNYLIGRLKHEIVYRKF